MYIGFLIAVSLANAAYCTTFWLRYGAGVPLVVYWWVTLACLLL